MLLVMPVLVLVPAVASGAGGQPEDGAPGDRKLVVGTKQTPPFAIKNADSSWSGLSIELWRQIAAELGVSYELREMDLPALLDGLREGSLDAGVAALTVTEEREATIDFSHPFHSAGLGIAVKPHGGGRWLAVLARLVSLPFLGLVGVLFLLLFVVGALVWIFERRRNPDQFGEGASGGIWAAFWWAAVTMTTVGYGDKAPKSAAGRLVAIIWMFAGIVLISAFTAAITTTLTVSQLESAVQGPQDLPGVRVATVADTTSQRYLQRRGIAHRAFDSPLPALQALVNGRVDAVVYDAPILRHLVATRVESPVRILPTTFERQDYAFGLTSGSPLREAINRSLLKITSELAWEDLVRKYLGN
jgi:ABC-type amino acid transport substrate-binding protein